MFAFCNVDCEAAGLCFRMNNLAVWKSEVSAREGRAGQ